MLPKRNEKQFHSGKWVTAMNNMYVYIAVAGVVIASFSQILLKIGANRPHVSFLKDYLNVPVISGYALMFVSTLAAMLAYRGLSMMTVPIIEAIGFILVPILSRLFFKEKITKEKLIGIAIIAAGIVIYNI